MKRIFITLILATICGFSVFAYSFPAMCSSGQTLFYQITSSTAPYTVKVTYQREATSSNNYTFYSSYPTGDLVIPSTVTYNNITYSVTSIGEFAFYECRGLTSVTIPNSVTSIDNVVFWYCSRLTSIFVEQGNSVYDSRDNCNAIIETETNTLIVGCMNTIIPNSVTGIFHNAFYGCSGLTSITIPNSVTEIGLGAFRECSGLTSVKIGNGVTGIPDGTFKDCSRLASVTIGSGVTQIRNAFTGCNALTDIFVNRTTPPNILYYTFDNFTATVWVPCGSAEAYRADGEWSNFSDIRERSPYTLNVSSANLTMGTASITQQPICSNGNAIIVATPNYGYRFVQWNDGNTSNPRNITVTADVEYTASFAALPTYTITAVSADETKGIVTGGGTYYEGETATLTATANNGYWFVAWTDGSTDNPRTITVTGNATYTATFVAFHTITVRSADTNMGTVSGGGTYTEGLQVEISATPAAHHHFVQWNDGNTDNPRTITVSGDATYTASFEPDQHTVTVVSADEAMGTVSEGGTYDYGTEIQISANPAEGYGFATWNDGNTDNPRTITVTEDITYTATFGVLRTITVVSADETMGTASGSGTYTEGSLVEISATPTDGYAFVQWNDGNTDNPRTIIVTENVTYTASFVNTYTIIAISANQNRGTVTGSGIYAVGSVVTIEAIAAEGFQFSSWNDNNNENPRYITVTGNATYIASFIPSVQNYTVTVVSANPEQGSVTGGGTYPEGTEIQISATPAEGYGFATWNDGNTDNPRTVTVVADATYIASFTSLTGIDESAVSEIAIFPNPANDILNITSSETISEIEIVNVMGQVVKRMEVNSDNAVCDVEDLTSGVYVVRISTAQSDTSTTLSVRKFVKE